MKYSIGDQVIHTYAGQKAEIRHIRDNQYLIEYLEGNRGWPHSAGGIDYIESKYTGRYWWIEEYAIELIKIVENYEIY